MIHHKILCEICDEPLARAYLPNLTRPLTAGQFIPLEKGFPDPFPDPSSTWEWLLCPHCKKRPFEVTEQQASDAVSGLWPGPEQVKTDKGMYRINTSLYPGIPPQISIQIHTDEQLEAEWKARAEQKKPQKKKEQAPKQKPGKKKNR